MAFTLAGSHLLGDPVEGAAGKGAPSSAAALDHHGCEVEAHGAALRFGLLVLSFAVLVVRFKHDLWRRNGTAEISALHSWRDREVECLFSTTGAAWEPHVGRPLTIAQRS